MLKVQGRLSDYMVIHRTVAHLVYRRSETLIALLLSPHVFRELCVSVVNRIRNRTHFDCWPYLQHGGTEITE